MSQLEQFEETPDCAFYRPVGEVTLQEAVHLVTSAIMFARERGIRRLLVDVLKLTGFASPSLADRYFLAREWAAAAKSSLRVVLVARSEMIDPDKFGVLVARNAGLDANIFASEAESLAWLVNDPAR